MGRKFFCYWRVIYFTPPGILFFDSSVDLDSRRLALGKANSSHAKQKQSKTTVRSQLNFKPWNAWLFKYGGFLLDNFILLRGSLGIAYQQVECSIALPARISFYTFLRFAHAIDIYCQRTTNDGCVKRGWWNLWSLRLRRVVAMSSFLRIPSSGEIWPRDETEMPKAEFWNAFATQTSATRIYSRDIPTLRYFEFPDGSHLDRRDAPQFTDALSNKMVARDVLNGETQPE